MSELVRLFLRLGLTAFGGPAAHIAMMEDEIVRRRAWLTREEFLDMLGATNFIPGPNSTEMAIHVGYRRAGFPGLVVAGTCFILPAALLVATIAWAYVSFGRLPQVEGLLAGTKPVIIAIVLQALARFARTAAKSPWLVAIGLAAFVAVLAGLPELAVLAVAGALAVAPKLRHPHAVMAIFPFSLTAGAAPFSLGALFLFFLKIGSILFGSGYVLLAFLRADLVDRLHWLTDAQLLDAIAVGQITPGPVFTTATFVGYLLAGPQGAAISTVGIFLPAFVFVAISGPLVARLRASALAGAFLDGVNVASLALMAWVTAVLARTSIVNVWTAALAIGSALLLWRTKLNATWLLAAGAAAGLLFKFSF